MVTYSIEFAHIYSNQNVGREHKQSGALFHELREYLDKKGVSYKSVVLIDDYNATEQILKPKKLISVLSRIGAKPHYVAYESQLLDVSARVLKSSNGHEGKSSRRFVSQNNKLPCSLLIAGWYLVRLGIVQPPDELFDWGLSREKAYEPAKYLINFLPDYYRDVENRACALLQDSQYHEACARVKNNYFGS